MSFDSESWNKNILVEVYLSLSVTEDPKSAWELCNDGGSIWTAWSITLELS
jgi:hypothetical protein